MIYIRIKFLYCILLMYIFSSIDSQPGLSLRQKLERLLQDPEYDDANNEIHKPHQRQGMLLKDLRERGLFDTSSEERIFARLKTMKETPESSFNSKEENISPVTITTMRSRLTTTSRAPTKVASAAPTSSEKPSRVIGGIENLSSIIRRFIDIWRK